ncbi:MAG: hypothetical protein FWG13_07730 [Leptospirales bacterium]|nr:hypothetical protein [Leptospirales bacterium]
MKVGKRLCCVFIIVISTVFSLSGEEKISEAEQNYLALRDLYIDWKEALFGSKNVRRRDLYRFCLDLIGNEIESGVDFALLAPQSIDGRSIGSLLSMPEPSWLYVHGELDEASFKDAVKNSSSNWKRLFKIKGRVLKFRLDRNPSADNVDLWLEKIFIY